MLGFGGFTEAVNTLGYAIGAKPAIVLIDGYAYLVPYIQESEEIFLKTIIPSRKATKKYVR